MLITLQYDYMHYLFQRIRSEKGNLFSIIITSAVNIFASFFLVLAFANFLDPQSLGVYQYIVATVSIIASLSLTGIGPAIIRAAGKKDYYFFPIAFRYTFIGLAISLIFAALISSYYLYKENYTLGLGMLIPTFFLLTLQYLLRYNSIYVGIEEFKRSNYLLQGSALAPFFILLPALFFIDDPVILASLYFGSSALIVAIFVWRLKIPRKIDGLIKNVTQTYRDKKYYLAFAVHQSVINFIYNMTAHLDKILVFQLLGAQATAVYFISISIPDRIRSIIKQFEPYLFSKFSKYENPGTRKVLIQKFLLMILIIIPLFIGYILLAPLFFAFFLSQYAETVNLSLIYSFSLFAAAMIIPKAYLQAHAQNRTFYYISTFYGIARLLFILLGVYYFGIAGAVYGACISLVVLMLITLIFALKLMIKARE